MACGLGAYPRPADESCGGRFYAAWLAECERLRGICQERWEAIGAAQVGVVAQAARRGKAWERAIADYEQSRGVRLTDLDSTRDLKAPSSRGMLRAGGQLDAARAAHEQAVQDLAEAHAECPVCFSRWLAEHLRHDGP